MPFAKCSKHVQRVCIGLRTEYPELLKSARMAAQLERDGRDSRPLASGPAPGWPLRAARPEVR
jgi:hypothetical protein